MNIRVFSLLTLVGAVVVLLLPQSVAAQSGEPDPVLCHPGFAVFARQHPADWEDRIEPELRPVVEGQRTIGFHALIVGWSDEEPNPTYTPRVVISVAYWDGTDLFALGLPRTYNGKPVVIQDVGEIPQAGAVPGGTGQDGAPPGCPSAWWSAPQPGAPVDFAVPNGWFYTQASGQPGRGYSVTDEAGIRFWSEFQRLGGVQSVGYPISHRFVWDGFVSQAFQKMVFQWRPEVGQVYAVNVVDLMHERGLDDWLQVHRATPPIADWSADAGRSWSEIVAAHQALLTDADFRDAYYAVPDPVTLYGLPMAPIQDMGNVLVLRMQRGILQKWLVDTPWAQAGQVTIANSGDVAKEAGLLLDALTPASPEPTRSAAVTPAAIAPSPASAEEKRAEQVAREHLQHGLATEPKFPQLVPTALRGLARATANVWQVSENRWLVVFPSVELPCLLAWPQSCPLPGAPAPGLPSPSPSPNPTDQLDLFVCVDSTTWQPIWSGRSRESLGPTSPLPCRVPPTGAEWVEQRARSILTATVGADPLARAQVETREAPDGWTVIFHDAYAECGTDGAFWPGACRFQKNVFRDLHVCIERDGLVIPHGQRTLRLGGTLDSASARPADPCAGAFDPIRATKAESPVIPMRKAAQ